MRRFVVEVVVTAIEALLILLVLSFIRIPQPWPFGLDSAPIVTFGPNPIVGLLIFAAILSLVSRGIQPVIVAVTGRYVLSTGGLFLIVVNAVVIWVSAALDPLEVVTLATPVPLWLLLIAAAYTIVSMLVDAIIGFNRPVIDDAGHGQFIWRLLDTLPTPRRNRIIENYRLRQVYDTIYRYGLDIVLEDTPIGRTRAWFERRVLGVTDIPERASPPARVRIMLQQLGPTYVKIGQMIASRREAIPPDWLAELEKLQSNVAPFPWEQAREIIIAELGRPPEELFATIEHEPFAAASTAQVHRATLPDGTEVAVKVQRPRIVAKTKADLGVLTELAKTAEDRFEMARKLGAEGIVEEFAAGVLKELDYRNEAYHAQRIAEGMKKFPQVHIPVVDPVRSSARVMTAEFVRGIKISDVGRLEAAGVDTKELGTVFIRALIKQVLVDGFFHGDPHPGNVLVDPERNRIIFLDFGLVGELRREQRLSIIRLLYALQQKDAGGIADGLLSLGTPSSEFSERGFRADIDRLVRQYLVYGEATSAGAALSAVLGAVFSNGLQLSNDLTLAMKAVIQAEETATRLSYDISLTDAALAEVRSAAAAGFDPARLQQVVANEALRVGQELLRRAPTLESAAWSWLDQFGKGRIEVHLDTSDLGNQVEKINDLGRQLAIGMLAAGQLIGSAILAVILLQPAAEQFQSLGYFAIIAFVIAFAISLYVLYRTLRGPDKGRRRSTGS
jgi:ubiquinone biosynthesis protein